MRKQLILPVLLLTSLSFVAFSPIDSISDYNDISENTIQNEFTKEVGSFTEMYTRTYLSDKTVWAHRYKEYTLTSEHSDINSIEHTLGRN